MKKIVFLLLGLAVVTGILADTAPVEAVITGEAAPPASKLCLWYREPATVWMTQALPIGNGQFGAMVFGGICKDEIQFNDKTLWTGNASSYGYYQNFGSLFIKNDPVEQVSDYRRELDLENGIAGVRYVIDGVEYTREYFASYPDSAVVIRYSASQGGKINAELSLASSHNAAVTYSGNEASFSGRLDLLSYHTNMLVLNEEGTLATSGEGIKVSGANSMLVILRGCTNFDENSRTYAYSANNLAGNVGQIVSAAASKSYKTLKDNHMADYKRLFDRVSFDLDGTVNTVPTDELIAKYNRNQDANLFLEVLYFHYGRYLMTGCARSGVNLPSNLQGIWCNQNDPPWRGDIHSNINVQMNYWPAEPVNLSELHLTFLKYIHKEATKENGQWYRNATGSDYSRQSKGWTLFTENNIFGYHGGFMHNYVIANAWYCMHLWQHYRYTLDKDYLRDIAFEPMKSCTDYWLERLVLASDGTYECPNEFSPEHGPGSENATAHSQQLVWDLFNNTLQAIEVLGEDVVDEAFLADLRNKFEKLDKGLAVESGRGQLKEWKYSPNSAGQPNHRHMSHLIGLYPGNQISPFINQTYFNAAKRSLTGRGDASTGWSMGWKINLWARSLEGDHARTILKMALKLSTNTDVDYTNDSGGIYQNMFCSHSPFQIDGNFGATAGIAEMLLQSHADILQLLPALPAAWKKGDVRGLRAVGGFEVDIQWDSSAKKMVSVIASLAGTECVVSYPHINNAIIRDGNNNRITPETVGADMIKFPTLTGGKYTIAYDGNTGISAKETETANKASLLINKGKLTIVGEDVSHGSIATVSGQMVYSYSDSLTFALSPGSYIVSVCLADGTKEIKKIVF